ncbi:MAG TPA: hypothetical protein VIO61_09720 [Anaerolineaceae bacterium]
MILMICTACGGLPGASSQDKTDLLFWDDFSDPGSGWQVWSRSGSIVEYANGGLRIMVNEPQFDFWSVPGQRFGDIRIEVDATKVGGPDDNDFGILCRYQGEGNFYVFWISSDGYFGIGKMKENQLSLIGSSQLQYSADIRRGQQTNHLRADCVRESLVLYVNGKKLIEALDRDLMTGDVGLVAGAFDVPGTDILFDNFLVRKP